ncbi:MAG TPA: ATP-binding cassette domain-containing protein [Rhodanobacteraceae bacterium]|jgi:phospholipid/cholesterol/gamma-HCH transport system ATP-binding protein|nr:ATP-binding cassette domain-containing protein [Rhodanobacteraceae bacterium]
MSERETVIEVRGLRNQFGDQVVHENLNLDVYKGEILGVVGGSGSGKSVLLRSIIGLNRPGAGSIKLFGQEVTRLTEAQRSALEQRCGVLFQNGALFSSLTVAENVMVPLREHHDLPMALMQRLAALKIALAGLPADAGAKYPAQLSGGMVKRAALARSLALDPDIFFLDEPTAGLDPIGAAAFDQLILTLRESLGLTVFLITHDLDTLYTICDRVAVIAEKRVLIADTLDKVERFDEPWVQEYFQGPRGRAAEHAAMREAADEPATRTRAAVSAANAAKEH